MPICFVIQPFDSGKFDKRFADVYKPAIEAAGCEAYRVDRDPGVEVPIDAIESGIRSATICLADITTDNPNVWYELGYAFASGRSVVMVCSKERTDNKYPFDIQHRSVLPYGADSPSDFEVLKQSLSTRLKALLTKNETLEQIASSDKISPIHGLTQPELFVIAEVSGSLFMPDASVPVYGVRQSVERAGLTSLGFSLGLRRLTKRGFIELGNGRDDNGEYYETVNLKDAGWEWIEANENLFKIHKHEPARGAGITDDDVPF